MGLLSVNIAKRPKLSLLNVKFSDPEARVEPTTILGEKPPTVECKFIETTEDIKPQIEKKPPQIEFKRIFWEEPTSLPIREETPLKIEIQRNYAKKISNLDTGTLKFWKDIFKVNSTLKERELINVLLEIEHLEESPSNNTKMLNEIFRDEYSGYIKQTDPYSHIWEVVKIEDKTKIENTSKLIDKLTALTQDVIKRENSYSREDIIERIRETTSLSQDRAEEEFNLILQAGAIEITPGSKYYLTGSTPF